MEPNRARAVGPETHAAFRHFPRGKLASHNTLTPSVNPGDNFRAVAAGRGVRLNRPFAVSEHADGAIETAGRVFYDTNRDKTHDAGEQLIDKELTIENVRYVASDLLTVWRHLYLEVDSLGAPNPNITNQAYGFTPDQNDDDPRPGDIPDPDTSLVSPAFQQAFIDVQLYPETQPGQVHQSDLPFVPYPTTDQVAVSVYAGANGLPRARQSVPDKWYWSLYAVGLYEALVPAGGNAAILNNDPNTEHGIPAWNMQTPQGGISMILMEPVRDIAWQHRNTAQDRNDMIAEINPIATLHELGHSFGLQHNGPFLSNIMAPPATDAQETRIDEMPATFNDDDLFTIRKFGINQHAS